MIAYRFHIDDLEIDEPMGFADLVINMTRDEQWHGVFFEASTSDLRFYGEGADYLREKKETLGLKAEVIFKAEAQCDGELDYSTILQGKLNMGRYREYCGKDCYVAMNVEQENCTMTLRNRYDQKVDVAATTAFDKVSALAPYDKIDFEMSLTAKDLEARVEGYSQDDTNEIHAIDYPDNTAWGINIRPTYTNQKFNSINQGQLVPFNNYTELSIISAQPISPQLLYDDNDSCFSQDFDYIFRFKGRFRLNTNATGFNVVAHIVTWDGEGSNIFNESTPIQNEVILSTDNYIADTEYDFDVYIAGSIDLASGIGFYGFLQFSAFNSDIQDFLLNVDFDPETYVLIVNNKSCPPTTAKVNAVHETLSRVTEAITNNCLKVKSEYYGRTDSQPYTSLVDGCGSLRVLTNGLHLRKDENARFFASFKELYEGLKAIDNIGMGIEPNPNIAGFDWLRIEDIGYFYQETEVLRLPYVPGVEVAIDEAKHYSLIKVGYKKWEVETVNGLDEPNSNKEYRTSLSSINNTLDITSNLVSGSYAIEVTRQQSFAASGGADTKYDNDIFIICVDRGAYGFQPEQDNISGGTYAAGDNIYSPETVYNWRIRPYYNLMRWFKSIINSYPNMVDPQNKLFFSAGTGNILASGELVDGIYDASGCKLENGVKSENDDLGLVDFLNETEARPLWRPEIITVKDYPLSLKDYKLLKAQPYGYITVQCGSGDDFKKGFVQSIEYKPTKGSADFILKRKWQ